MAKDIIIYTDGSCFPNPGPGGYGAVIIYPDKKEKWISGGFNNTTNNRMELFAVIKSIEIFKKPCNIFLYSDSEYIINGISRWLDNWIKHRKVMKNMDLWRIIYDFKQKHNIITGWVRGHSGNKYNELTFHIILDNNYYAICKCFGELIFN